MAYEEDIEGRRCFCGLRVKCCHMPLFRLMAPSTGVVDLKGLDDVQACSVEFQLRLALCFLPCPCQVLGSWNFTLQAAPNLGVVLANFRASSSRGGYAAVLAPLWKARQVLQGNGKPDWVLICI